MPGEAPAPGALSRACGWAFIAGIVMLAVELLSYMLVISTSGMVFASGMALLLASALVGAFADRSKPKLEDLVTIGIGACFFIWLAWKA